MEECAWSCSPELRKGTWAVVVCPRLWMSPPLFWGMGIITSCASALGTNSSNRFQHGRCTGSCSRDVGCVGIALAWAFLVSIMVFVLFVYSIFCQCPFLGIFLPLLKSHVVQGFVLADVELNIILDRPDNVFGDKRDNLVCPTLFLNSRCT